MRTNDIRLWSSVVLATLSVGFLSRTATAKDKEASAEIRLAQADALVKEAAADDLAKLKQARLLRGLALADLGRYGEALPELKAGAAKGDADYHAGLGQVLFALAAQDNDYHGQAWQQLEEAVRIAPGHPRARFWRGRMWAAGGQTTQAIAEYQRAYEGGDLLAGLHLAAAMMQIGDFTGAFAQYDRVVRSHDSDPQPRVARGWARFTINQADQALDDFNAAIALAPQAAEPYLYRAKLHAAAGRHDAAIEDLTNALKLDPQSSQACFDRAAAHRAAGRLDDALADYGKWIELNPQDAARWMVRGNLLLELKRYDAAIDDYNRAVELNPRDSNLLLARGKAFLATAGHVDRAVKDVTAALELNPKDVFTLAALGDAHAAAGRDAQASLYRGRAHLAAARFAEAEREFSRAIELQPDFAEALLERGVTLRDWALAGKDRTVGRTRLEAARKDLARAITLLPDSARAHLENGWTVYQFREFEAARKSFERASELDPGNPLPPFRMGLTYHFAKDFDRACQWFTRTLAIDPKFDEAYALRAAAELGRKRFTDALADYDRAIAIRRPPDAGLRVDRGLCLTKLGRYDEAMAEYNEAIRIEPNHASAYYRRGNIYAEQKRDRARALADFERAVSLAPDKASYREALQYERHAAAESSVEGANPVVVLGAILVGAWAAEALLGDPPSRAAGRRSGGGGNQTCSSCFNQRSIRCDACWGRGEVPSPVPGQMLRCTRCTFGSMPCRSCN